MFTDCCHYLLILSIYCAFNLSKLGFCCWGASAGYAAKTGFSAALQLYNILFTMCFFSAIACFMCSNFSLSNVFTNSNVNTPLLFQISATWSNHEGSLLLWCWLLTLFGRSLAKSKVLYERQSLAPRNPSSANTGCFLWGTESGLCFTLIKTSVTGVYADFNTAIFRGLFRSRCLLIYLFIVLFFALFLLTTSNPFLKNQFLCFNSIAELNPVLQDPVLAIHPPCIYTGYVASAVGFSLCLSRSVYVLTRWKMGSAVLRGALLEVLGRPERENRAIISAAQGRLTLAPELRRFFFYDDNFVYNDIWLHIRFWISICWCFLTLGILLGSWWAYHELGWGGWWFWDPVENASLMPWLFATACIHSVLLPRLNYWTLFFNLFTFVLSILGTFFVRSGLLASVHSFATDSTRGFCLLTFVVCIAAIAPLQWFGLLIVGRETRVTSGTPLFFNTDPAHCARDLRDYLLFSRQLLNEKLLGDAQRGIAAPFCRQTLAGLCRRRTPAEQRHKGRGWGNRPKKQIEQLLQLQNCLFLILTGIVLCGTAAPILFQLFSDRDVTTGAPFFNGTIVPLVCCILLMLIFVHCLMLQFSQLKASLLPRKPQLTPKIPGVFAQFVYNFVEGVKLCKTSVDYRVACFVLVAITMIFVHFFAFYFVAEFSVLESTYCVLCFTLFCILLLSTSKRSLLPSALSFAWPKSRSLPAACFLLASSSNLRAPMASNMKIAHMGLLVFITGILLSNRKKTHCSLQMRSSFELRLGDKICCLRSIDQNVGPTFRSICGNVIIYQQRLKRSRSGEPFTPTDFKRLQDAFVMFPETRFSFSNPELSTTKVAIHTNLLSDIYMLIGTGSTDSGWFVTTMQLPYIFCIWLGFLLAAIAGFNSIALLLKQQTLNWA